MDETTALVTTAVPSELLLKAIGAYSTKMDIQELSEVTLKLNGSDSGNDPLISLFLLQMLSHHDPECLSALGDRYYMGDCVYADREIALQIFRKAAEQGSARSAYDLGWYYYETNEYLQAAEYFEKCIANPGVLTEKQIGQSHSCLGHCYMSMSDQKYSKGFEHLCIAADKYHSAHADRVLAHIYSDPDKGYFDPQKCIQHYTKAAKNGDVIAAQELASYYVFGNEKLGIKMNRALAEEIVTPFESTKDPELLRVMGLVYLRLANDDTQQQDWQRACTFLERAAEISDSGAICGELGYAYFRLKRYADAEKFFLQANQKGFYFYSDFLGRIYRDGMLGTKDLQKAKNSYEIAYRTESINNLFTCSEYVQLLTELGEYEKAYEAAHYGEETYKDIWFLYLQSDLVLKKRVFRHMTIDEALHGIETCLSMNAHVADASLSMGLYCYETRDYRLAVKHLQTAYNAGSADAAVHLGRLYENGGGTVKANEQTAYEWFEKAANGGSELGKKELSCWKKKLFGGYRRVRSCDDRL